MSQKTETGIEAVKPYRFMKVLLIASLTAETGNFSTAERLHKSLCESKYDCYMHSVSCFKDRSLLSKFISTQGFKCVIGIHAWRAGRLLLECPIPFAIVFGGTDLNEHCKDEEKFETMSKVVGEASYIVAFSKPMKKQALLMWPGSKNKIILQPQAVCVAPSGFKLYGYLKQRRNSLLKGCKCSETYLDLESSDLIVFMLVAGLRRVKDPLYLAKVVADWHKEDRSVHLIIVGPELDSEFASQVKTEVERLPGVAVIQPLLPCDLHAAMQNSFAIVNSSLSEGMASAILESMHLGVPVLARNIPGNSAVIQHKETGLLFDTPEQFVKLARELRESPSLRNYLTTNAKTYVSKHHSLEKESKTYQWLVEKLISYSN